MGNGWHEWPLIIFTVLGQCVVGGFWVMALLLLSGKLDTQKTRRVHLSMFFLWVLMGIGFIASVMHLGSPLRAMNSLNRLGESALSNEIAAGSLFFVLGGVYWLLAVLNKLSAAVGRIWLMAAMLAGLIFVYAMSRVYAINTVPTWDSAYTPWQFFLTMLVGGPLLGMLLLRTAIDDWTGMRWLAMISGVALVASIAVSLMQTAGLADISSSVHQASALVPQYGHWLVGRFLLLVLGLSCWFYPLMRGKTPSVAGLSLAMVLVFGGEMIGRALFYGLHMTVGMAIAG